MVTINKAKILFSITWLFGVCYSVLFFEFFDFKMFIAMMFIYVLFGFSIFDILFRIKINKSIIEKEYYNKI